MEPWLAFDFISNRLPQFSFFRSTENRCYVTKEHVARDQSDWPHIGLIRAALAFQSHRVDDAIALLDRAAAVFEREAMALHAAAARRRMGQLLASHSGQAVMEEADAWMAAQGVKNPARMTDLLAPGFGNNVLTRSRLLGR